MSASNDILQHIRQAQAHADAAIRHEDRYGQQMRAAGASMYQAFTLALKGADEYRGRKLDEKAILRLYKSTTPRPWWDAHLCTAKLVDASGRADRDKAKRLIQWHVDPDGAQERRAQAAMRALASKKRLSDQKVAQTQGAMRPKSAPAREAVHSARITEANTTAALGGRELEAGPVHAASAVSMEDLLGELNRISAAVRRVKAGERDAVLEILRVTAREVEGHV
jgi:hypothetical protein